MLGHSHVVIGVAGVVLAEALARSHGTSLFEAPLVPLPAEPVAVPGLPLAVLCAAVGSLLPDLDHPRAALANYRVVGIPILKPAGLVASAVLSHRGASHSLVFWALLTALGAYFASPLGLAPLVWAASLGYGLHLVADTLTKAGVPWLWPLWPHPLGFPPARSLRIHTGGLVEHLLVACAVVGAIAAALSSHLLLS